MGISFENVNVATMGMKLRNIKINNLDEKNISSWFMVHGSRF
jgi:hypothetical protein